jgi:hypothetical protein
MHSGPTHGGSGALLVHRMETERARSHARWRRQSDSEAVRQRQNLQLRDMRPANADNFGCACMGNWRSRRIGVSFRKSSAMDAAEDMAGPARIWYDGIASAMRSGQTSYAQAAITSVERELDSNSNIIISSCGSIVPLVVVRLQRPRPNFSG